MSSEPLSEGILFFAGLLCLSLGGLVLLTALELSKGLTSTVGVRRCLVAKVSVSYSPGLAVPAL